MKAKARHEAHWRATVRLTTSILLLCIAVTFLIGLSARQMGSGFFGLPLSFYLGAQGAPIVYGLLIWWYTRRMDRLDRAAGVSEGDGDDAGVLGAPR